MYTNIHMSRKEDPYTRAEAVEVLKPGVEHNARECAAKDGK